MTSPKIWLKNSFCAFLEKKREIVAVALLYKHQFSESKSIGPVPRKSFSLIGPIISAMKFLNKHQILVLFLQPYLQKMQKHTS